MANDPPLIRQWILLKTLAARHYGATVEELAQEAGVSIKTIRRDLIAFTNAGFPLEESRAAHGLKRWKLGMNGTAPQLSFALDEALALYLGRRFLEPLAGTLLWEAARSIAVSGHASDLQSIASDGFKSNEQQHLGLEACHKGNISDPLQKSSTIPSSRFQVSRRNEMFHPQWHTVLLRR